MKIWLDDIRPAPDGFIWAHDLFELAALLETHKDQIELMSFDHDLGDGIPDGYMIIKWLAEHYLNRWPETIRVHSANPPGAKNIRCYAEFIYNRVLST